MATKRKLVIKSITQVQGGAAKDLTDDGNAVVATAGDVTVKVGYTTEGMRRGHLVLSVHLPKKDATEGDSRKRHKKGEVIFDKKAKINNLVAGTEGVENFAIPGAQFDMDKTVYVIHVRDRDGLSAVSRFIRRDT